MKIYSIFCAATKLPVVSCYSVRVIAVFMAVVGISLATYIGWM